MKLENFKELYVMEIDNDIKTDYKGLKYLSWATAYKLAMIQDPTMTFEVLEDEEGMPLFSRNGIHFVKTAVTIFGETKKMILPVMDNRHNAVEQPDSRDINDSIMRCLVKNIALFGLGLRLYVGEDLQQCNITLKDNEDEEKKNRAIKLIENLEADPLLLKEQLKKYKCAELKNCSNEQLKFIYTFLKNNSKKGA